MSAMTHERDQKSLFAINLGLGINVLLAIVKTTFGILGHSPALLAEGINSTSDVAYYIAASVLVRMANQPADREHPYGHRQFESIGSLLIGSFIVATAVAVFWDAVDKVWDFISGVSTSQGEELQAHRFGPHIVLTLIIGIDGALSVYAGDDIASRVEETLLRAIPNVRRVHVHYHPAEEEHADLTIDEILDQSKNHGSPHQPEYHE